MKNPKKCRNRVRTTTRIMVSLPIVLHDEMIDLIPNENWSAIATEAFRRRIEAVKKADRVKKS